MSTLIGFFGKIPARGDFIRSGLGDATVGVLDGWIARNLGVLQHRQGESFDAIWEHAPIWRFTLDAGVLDPKLAASGLWIPSIDRAGRCFPLVLVALHPETEDANPLLDGLRPAMRAAVESDSTPEVLQAAIDAAVRGERPWIGKRVQGNVWRRPAIHDGSPVVLHAALPDGDGFEPLLRLLPAEIEALSPAVRG